MDELTEKGYLVGICSWLQQQPENKYVPKTDESSMFYHTSELQFAKLILRFVREETDSKYIGNCNKPDVSKCGDVEREAAVCDHPRDKRTYIGQGWLKCGVCGKEFK